MAASLVLIPILVFLDEEDLPGNTKSHGSSECMRSGIALVGTLLMVPSVSKTDETQSKPDKYPTYYTIRL